MNLIRILLIVLIASNCFAEEIDFTATPDFIDILEERNSSTPYYPRIELTPKYGNERMMVRGKGLSPLIQSYNRLTYISAIGWIDSLKSYEGNIGLGARWLQDNYIIGGYGFIDLRRVRKKTFFK